MDIGQPQTAFVTLLVKHEPGVDARRLVPDWDSVDEALREANVIIWRSRGAWGSKNRTTMVNECSERRDTSNRSTQKGNEAPSIGF
ncbi:MAG: hypothetical protein ACPGXX_16300 [Planctomycetaceae bacterium]